MTQSRIVLLESDHDYRSNLSGFLEAHGFEVIAVETLADIHAQSQHIEWTIYLLNFGTNTSFGLEFLATRDRRSNGPVLILSDSDDHIDRIVYLELGADDYIVKTARDRETLARIRVAQRRRPSAALPSPTTEPIDSAPPPRSWRFSSQMQELVAPDGIRIDLTTDQFNLLDVLVEHNGKALSRDFLSHTLFNRLLQAGDRSIDNLVVRLRRRLGEPARAPRIVKTARGDGYFFDGFPEARTMDQSRCPIERRCAA